MGDPSGTNSGSHSGDGRDPRQVGPRPTYSIVTRLAMRTLRLAGQIMRGIVQALLAIVIVFEEWGWRPLAAALARLGRLKPFAWMERQIQALPPYAALAVFLVPSALLFPLKLLALYLIAAGYKLAAGSLFVGAKVVGTAIVARLFQLTEAQLMRIGWFKRIYDVVMPWKEALVGWVRESWAWRYGRIVKARLKKIGSAAAVRWRPTIERLRGRVRVLVAGWLWRR